MMLIKRLSPVSYSLKAATICCISIVSTLAQALENTQSGYEKSSAIAGPASVKAELHDNDKERQSAYAFSTMQKTFKPYFDWKRDLNNNHGVSVGFSAYWLYQEAGEASMNDTNGSGQIYRFQGSWNAITLNDDSTGSLNWRLENRSEMGGQDAPATLGGGIAGTLNPGFGYSENFDTDLSVLNWTQGFNGNRAGVAAGRLAFDAYLDAFAFQTFSRGFLNRAFILSPTMGTTGIGALGAVVKGFLSDKLWLGAHIYDGNAASGDFDMDTFKENEYLKAVEFGWTPSEARYKTDRIQFTYWKKDEREKVGIDEGDGWLISASFQIADNMLPFVRYGNSDGGAGVVATQSLSGGIDIQTRPDQNLSVGLAWSELNENKFGKNVDDEWVIETSYKFQLSKNFSFTPDLQWLKNPANLVDEDSTWVTSMRGILTL